MDKLLLTGKELIRGRVGSRLVFGCQLSSAPAVSQGSMLGPILFTAHISLDRSRRRQFWSRIPGGCVDDVQPYSALWATPGSSFNRLVELDRSRLYTIGFRAMIVSLIRHIGCWILWYLSRFCGIRVGRRLFVLPVVRSPCRSDHIFLASNLARRCPSTKTSVK